MMELFSQANDISKRLETLERSSMNSLTVLKGLEVTTNKILIIMEWFKGEIEKERDK